MTITTPDPQPLQSEPDPLTAARKHDEQARAATARSLAELSEARVKLTRAESAFNHDRADTSWRAVLAARELVDRAETVHRQTEALAVSAAEGLSRAEVLAAQGSRADMERRMSELVSRASDTAFHASLAGPIADLIAMDAAMMAGPVAKIRAVMVEHERVSAEIGAMARKLEVQAPQLSRETRALYLGSRAVREGRLARGDDPTFYVVPMGPTSTVSGDETAPERAFIAAVCARHGKAGRK